MPPVDREAALRFAYYCASRPTEHERLKAYWTNWFRMEDKLPLDMPQNPLNPYTAANSTGNPWTPPPDWGKMRGTRSPCCETATFTDKDLSILTEAHGLVHGDRQRAYGHPAVDFSRTAALANVLLASKLSRDLGPEDVALFMVCVKLSRECHEHARDNLIDACGYLECRERVLRFIGDAPRTSKDAQ